MTQVNFCELPGFAQPMHVKVAREPLVGTWQAESAGDACAHDREFHPGTRKDMALPLCVTFLNPPRKRLIFRYAVL